MYINCLSFLVRTNFIYGGGEYRSSESLNAYLIFPPLTRGTQRSQSLDEFEDVRQVHYEGDGLQAELACLDTVHFIACLYGTSMPLITSLVTMPVKLGNVADTLKQIDSPKM